MRLLHAIAVDRADGPDPSGVHNLIKGWIGRAQEERAAGREMDADENEFSTAWQRFGALAQPDRRLQVAVHFKRLCCHRCILLHFTPRLGERNVKELGFIYFGAAGGTLHGLHVAPDSRGGGLMKREIN